ncbi:MAG: hypothetical protein ACLTZT_18075 [Butyricimonas faecalis]
MSYRGQKSGSNYTGNAKGDVYLDNGEQVVLADNNTVVVEGSLSGRIEQVDKSLVYQTESTVKEERLNVLEILMGRIQVTLADGTKVCLNAGTKQTSDSFRGKEQQVRLEGKVILSKAR